MKYLIIIIGIIFISSCKKDEPIRPICHEIESNYVYDCRCPLDTNGYVLPNCPYNEYGDSIDVPSGRIIAYYGTY